jgi:hypothetical protein
MKNLFFLLPVLLLTEMATVKLKAEANNPVKINTRSSKTDYIAVQKNNAADTTKPVRVQPKKLPPPPANNTPAAPARMILYDFVVNYIAVSEATRNRIDNGDCKRVFGYIETELWELDDNNNKKTKLASYDNMRENMYAQSDYRYPPTAALSYYQDNRAEAANDVLGKVMYNIPEDLLNKRKVMLIVKTFLGTRHKDNDLASYDALRMRDPETSSYTLDNRASRSEMIQTITYKKGDPMVLGPLQIPPSVFAGSDDTHKIWVAFTVKKQ